MKKSELKSGMIIQTQHNRYGFVEVEKNRINICYDPDKIKDEDANLEMLSLDNVFDFEEGSLGVGFILDEETKIKYPDCYEEYEVGDIIIAYDIVAIYAAKEIYSDGVGAYPPIILE